MENTYLPPKMFAKLQQMKDTFKVYDAQRKDYERAIKQGFIREEPKLQRVRFSLNEISPFRE